MDVAVVGGSGFIGRSLVAELLGRGHQVTVYDLRRPPAELGAARWADPAEGCPARAHDALFMLAAQADVVEVNKDPVAAVADNVLLPARVYADSVASGVKRFLFASTIWVYDYADGHGEDARADIVSPSNPYSAGKLCAEVILRSLEQHFGGRLPLTVMRYGIPYGPGMRKHAVIPAFVDKVLRGDQLVVNGSLQVARPFLHVRDLARGNAMLLDAGPGTYNVSGERLVTLKDIIDELSAIFGSPPGVQLNEQRGIDTRATLSPIDRMRELGWRPEVSLREGLEEMIEFARSTAAA